MKLLTKLILGLGILLFIMLLAITLFLFFLIKQDVKKTAVQIEGLLDQDHQELVESRKAWLEDNLMDLQENVEAVLLMVNREKEIFNQLTFQPDNPLVNSWNALGRIAGDNPEVGFLQLHSPEMNQTAVIIPYAVEFYPIIDLYQENGEAIIAVFDPLQDMVSEHVYEAIALEGEQNIYALVKPQYAQRDISLPGQVQKISKDEMWEFKIEMIQKLIPLFVEGITLNSDEKISVEGIANDKIAIFAKEAFRTFPYFDGEAHYLENTPSESMPPMATAPVALSDPAQRRVYLGNTLLIDSNFLTIAAPIKPITQRFSLATKSGLLLHVNQDFWIGFNQNGNSINNKEIDRLDKEKILEKENTILPFYGKKYLFSHLGTYFNGDLSFYSIYSLANRLSILNKLKSFEGELIGRISLQLSLISLGIIVVILLFAIRFGLNIVYPITQLAQATKEIASGHYGEAILPSVGKRKDEVAILTHSFGEMIHGLQDRERIRGVLNKVVSKDVAQEILKTRIHLGGEDRIITILFSDIRGFTQLTRDFSPQKTIEMLNACMTKISRVIEGEGGVIDKYVGDEIMALYGAPSPHPDHALRAISTGMLIIETLKKWNQERTKEGKSPVKMGVGIHTGLVVAGNMGAEDRLNYTVLGANVNIAARLCEIARPYQLVISQSTFDEPNIKESFNVESLPSITLKGFVEPIQIYEVIGFKWG